MIRRNCCTKFSLMGHAHWNVLMWCCIALSVLSTRVVSSEEIYSSPTMPTPDFIDIPATFDSSAFDTNLYYRHGSAADPSSASDPCMPQHIHLSQSSDLTQSQNNNGQYEIDMTVSFTLDYKMCSNAIPTVYYGQGMKNEGFAVQGDKKEQFNYSSPKVGGFFESNWIYHIVLPNLQGGRKRTWYNIQVVSVADDDNSITTTNQKSSNDLGSRGAWITVTNTIVGSVVDALKGMFYVVVNGSALLQNCLFSNCITTTSMVRRRRDLEGNSHNTVSTTATTTTTATMTFLTPPLPGEPTALALIGDLGQTENSTKTMYHIFRDALNPSIKENPISLMLCAGDMAYADGDPQRWPSWFDLMEPLLRKLPLHVGAGNHEIECDNVTNNIFIQYEHYFRMPNRIGPAETKPITEDYRKTLWNGNCASPSAFQGTYNYGNAFYSFQHGLVHVIVLSSYSDTTVGSIQYQWFEYQLSKVFDRSKTPWLLVSFHTPFYTTFVGHNDEIEAVTMKESMEPLLVKYGVNLAVSGHDHAYMRTESLAYGKVDPTGRSPIYLTVGAGGNREQHSRSYKNETHPEPWVAKRDRYEYGYGHFFAANATHAQLKWVRDGTTNLGIQDVVWLKNPHAPAS